jgi:hypothetical protein
MNALAKASSNCKRQTRPLVREDVTYIRTMTASVLLENKKKNILVVGLQVFGAKMN